MTVTPASFLSRVVSSRPARVVFALYAVALFIGTHWPQLAIPMAGRPDLVVHLTIFSIWTVLLFVSGLLGDPRSWRAVALVQVVAAAYACVDEGLQAVPFIRRWFAWDDMMFNTLGVLLGTLINISLRRFLDRSAPPSR
ncbi:MAG: VanZ family protein [Phycisphaerales bacterium]